MVDAVIFITSLLILIGTLTFMKPPDPPTAKDVVQKGYVILILWMRKPSLCEVRQLAQSHRSLVIQNPVSYSLTSCLSVMRKEGVSQ